MIFQLILVLFVFFVSKKWLRDRRYSHFPGPSPFLSFPLIGHGYLLGDEPATKLLEMQKKYGDIFRFDIGSTPTIMLCKYEQLKEAFVKESFSGRYWNTIPTLEAIQYRDGEGKESDCTSFDAFVF